MRQFQVFNQRNKCLQVVVFFRLMTFGLLPAEETSSPLVIFLGDLKLATLLYSEQRAEDNDYGASLGALLTKCLRVIQTLQ